MTQPTSALKDRIYLIGERGHLLAFTSYPESELRSIYAIVKMSLTGEPLTSMIGGETYRHLAIVTKPAHTVLRHHAINGAACVIYPHHPVYRAINAIPAPGVVPLNRVFFKSFDSQLAALADRSISPESAQQLFDGICTAIADLLPPPPTLNAAVEAAVAQLRTDIDCSTSCLADNARVSIEQLNAAFANDFGIDLEQYRVAVKLSRAAKIFKPGIGIEDFGKAIGFASEAEFVAAFQEVHGAPPTYFQTACEIYASD